VRKVYDKLVQKYNARPTLATLLKWLSTERDPHSLKAPQAPTPQPQPARAPRNPACPRCDGSGWVKVIKQVHAMGVDGVARTTHVTGRLVDGAGRLVPCDHGGND
jgi:hypothetical protein